nr:rootletin [Parasteatoda tepidariorum]
MELKNSFSALNQEKTVLEKKMYSTQKEISDLQNERTNALRELNLQVSLVSTLQGQIKSLEELHKNCIDSAAKEKDSLLRKMDKIEEDFRIALRNEQQQHNIDINILNQEKESLRSRLISSVDELFDRHQKQQEELISFHQGEIATLKKHVTTLETEYEEKIINFQSENKKIHSDYRLEISSLEHSIENLKKQNSHCNKLVKDLEEKLENADKDRNALLQSKLKAIQQLEDEIKTQSDDHARRAKELENHIKDLSSEKETALNEVNTVETKLKQLELEKNKLIEEMEEANSSKKEEQSTTVHFESKINLLQNQLKDEISLNEVVNKSFDDCKRRLKLSQEENLELKQQLEEMQVKIKDTETSTARIRTQNAELQETMRNIEKSRQEYKREVTSIKRTVTNLEKTLDLKEQELNKLSMIHSQEGEIQEKLRMEIVELKQKLMQSSATNEAVLKELSSSKKKLSDFEHKLKMQEEQHQSELQDYLSTEHSFSVRRLNLEKSISESSKDLQNLRSSLRFEEGKVLALESKIVKLDGAKRDVENKLYSICLFLRSILNLGSDSGLLSASSNADANASSARRDVSETLGRDSTDQVESSHLLTFLKYNSPAHISVSDLDLELLKSSLRDLMQNFNAMEKERDDLKDTVTKIQRQYEELRSEHSRCTSRIYQLQRDLEDKKNVEQELATKIASIHHHEEVIRTLDREKRRLTEKMGSAEFNSTSVKKEQENLLNQIAELKQNEFKLEEDKRILSAAKELAESKAANYIQAYASLESNMMLLREKLNNKELEAKSLEHIADSSSRKIESLETKIKSLMTTVEQLNDTIEIQTQNERVLKNKIAAETSQNSETALNLAEDLERLQKERQNHLSNLFVLQKSNEQLRTYMDDYKNKSKCLKDEVEALKSKLKHSEIIEQDLLDQMRSLKNVLQRTQQIEKDASEETTRLQEEKLKIDSKLKTLNESLRSNQQLLQEKEELCLKLEKEKSSFKKALDKLEKDKQKISELRAKTLIEKSTLDRDVQRLGVENQSLLEKVQNLQAQLTEAEQRYSQSVKDYVNNKSFESKLEDTRYKNALKHAEQMIESRDRQNRQKVLGLEEQIKVLQNHLEREQERWRQYHQRSRETCSDIQSLHSVLGKSLQNVTDDAQKLLPEAERLNRTTETEVSTSGLFVSTPSKLRKGTSRPHFTSTPKSKKRLDLSSDQP